MEDDFAQVPFEAVEFADNPEPRCACVLLLDTSGSMQGEPIAALNHGLKQFATELKEDRLAAKRVDLAIVTFGEVVTVVSEFCSAQTFDPQPLHAKGGTPLGEAIGVGIDLLASRQAQYREAGIVPYRPWLFMVTDGKPTDAWQRSAGRIRAGEGDKKFTFFAVGVEGADMETLGQISVNTPLKLQGLAFSSLFRWLSSSLSAVSRSSVGTLTPLANPTAPNGWAMAG